MKISNQSEKSALLSFGDNQVRDHFVFHERNVKGAVPFKVNRHGVRQANIKHILYTVRNHWNNGSCKAKTKYVIITRNLLFIKNIQSSEYMASEKNLTQPFQRISMKR